jgi:hypothetical protein
MFLAGTKHLAGREQSADVNTVTLFSLIGDCYVDFHVII